MTDGLDTGQAKYVHISGPTKPLGNNFTLVFTSYAYKGHMLLPNHTYTLKLEAKDSKGNLLPDYSFIYGFYTQTQAGEFAQVDFGLGYAPHLKSLIGFSTVNFYFTAINSDADLQEIHGFERNFFLRFSVFMGIAPLTLSQATAEPIVNRFSLGNFVFGAAIRSPFYGYYTTESRVGEELLQPMRLTIGEMLFKQNSANPLITTPQNKGAVYIGLSYDLSLSSILGPIGKLLSP